MHILYKMSTLRVELLDNGIPPIRKTSGAAGYDLFTPMPLALSTGLHVIDLALKIELPSGTFGSIRCRSSLAAKGMSVEAGVIDEDYRGEWKVLLRVRDTPLLAPRGSAIAQLIVQPYLKPEVEVIHCVSATARGDGGFGSTGI